jgi:hypothetical protein
MNYPTRARAEYDLGMNGVRVAVVNEQSVRLWEPATYKRRDDMGEDPGFDAWLRLNDEEARAIYEALADYYGNATNDVRLLRQDYQAERARVDKMIGHLIARGADRG